VEKIRTDLEIAPSNDTKTFNTTQERTNSSMFSYFNDASLIKTRNQHKCQKNGLRTNLKVKLVVYFLLLTCATANVVNGDGWNISSGYYSKQVVLNLDTEWKCGEVEINRAMVGGTDII
jgi:hypothetical protein